MLAKQLFFLTDPSPALRSVIFERVLHENQDPIRNSPETFSINRTDSRVLPVRSAERWSELPALGMMENFLKSLNVFLFTNKSLLLTPRLGIICVQETRLSFLQHAADPLSHLFRLPPWGPALTNRLAQVESGSESCFCSPGPMGSFPPGPG